MKNSTLRCFVAMAVGKPDTDPIYDNHILPTLRAANIQSTFMGRLEHNDDINKRIIEEINACDFAIADLTYARPSVYFEAGFAERNVPVVYTCRRDHLHPHPDDKSGNFKVHFDLVTRNIIFWSDPGDRTFARRLARRVALVTKPLLRVRQEEAAVKVEERQFERIPLASRLNLVSEKFRNVLMRHGYRSIVKEGRTNPWVARRPERHALSLCLLHVQPKFSKRDIESHTEKYLAVFRSRFEYVADDDDEYDTQQTRWRFRWPGYKLPKPGETKGVKKWVGRIVLCSLERTPRTRLTAALPSYTADEAGNMFQWNDDERGISFSVYMLDPIRSERDIQARSLELRHVLKSDSRSMKPRNVSH